MIIKHKLESLGFYTTYSDNGIKETLRVWMHGEFVATFVRFFTDSDWSFFMSKKTDEWIVNYCSERAKEIKKRFANR